MVQPSFETSNCFWSIPHTSVFPKYKRLRQYFCKSLKVCNKEWKLVHTMIILACIPQVIYTKNEQQNNSDIKWISQMKNQKRSTLRFWYSLIAQVVTLVPFLVYLLTKFPYLLHYSAQTPAQNSCASARPLCALASPRLHLKWHIPIPLPYCVICEKQYVSSVPEFIAFGKQ